MKNIILIQFVICYSMMAFSQDTTCFEEVATDPFMILDVMVRRENVKKGYKVSYHFSDEALDVLFFDKESNLIRVNNEKVCVQNRVLNPYFTIGRNEFDSINETKKGVWIDSNIRYAYSTSDQLILGVGNYINGQRNGKWVFYRQFSLELYATLNYSNGVINGELNLYDGPVVTGEVNYYQNHLHGKFKFYHTNGQVAEFGINECDRIKEITIFKKNGNIRSTNVE